MITRSCSPFITALQQCLVLTRGWPCYGDRSARSKHQAALQRAWADCCGRRNRYLHETYVTPKPARDSCSSALSLVWWSAKPSKVLTPGWISFGRSYLTNSYALKWQPAFCASLWFSLFHMHVKTLSLFSVWDFMEILLVKCCACEEVRWGQNTGERSKSLIFSTCNL